MPHAPWIDEKGRQAWYREEWRKSGKPLAARTVMVTGAASGIGRATVNRLLAETAVDVVAVDVDVERLAQLRDHPDAWRITPVFADLSDLESLALLPDNVDVLINNAGRLLPAALHDLDLDEAEYTLRVMLRAPLHLTRRVLPFMRAQHWGVILNMGSVYGIEGGVDKEWYSIAKHGLLGLTRQIALENGALGIRSVLICPGHVEGPLLTRQVIDEAERDGVTPDDRERELRGQLATDRFVLPDEIAANVLHLLSDDARSISGCPYVIDGAWTAGTRSAAPARRRGADLIGPVPVGAMPLAHSTVTG